MWWNDDGVTSCKIHWWAAPGFSGTSGACRLAVGRRDVGVCGADVEQPVQRAGMGQSGPGQQQGEQGAQQSDYREGVPNEGHRKTADGEDPPDPGVKHSDVGVHGVTSQTVRPGTGR